MNFNKEEFLKDFYSLKKEISEENDFFHKLILDKNVFIIGPANTKCLLARSFDEADITVRFNTAIEFYPFDRNDLSERFGKKLDILYLNVGCEKGYLKNSRILGKLDGKTIRLVGGVIEDLVNGDTPVKTLGGRLKSHNEFFQKAGVDIRLYFSNKPSAFLSKHLSRCNKDNKNLVARTGYQAIVELLLYGAKSVVVKNLTFYIGGSNSFRSDSLKTLDPLRNHLGKNTMHHDSIIELNQLKILLEELGPKKLILSDELLMRMENL